MEGQILYISSFRHEIYVCLFLNNSRKLVMADRIKCPYATFAALSEDERFLYAGCEHDDGNGGIAVYDISSPLRPRLISFSPLEDQGPAYLEEVKGNMLLTCSYFSGTMDIFRVNDKAGLEECLWHKDFTTTGNALPAGGFGQLVPRAHCIRRVPETDMILVTDYSGDRLLCFRMEDEHTIKEVAALSFERGAAVRHLEFHPIYRDTVYINTEYTGTVYAVRIDQKKGEMSVTDRTPALPGNQAYMCSAIKVSPDGSYLYNANRENGSISVFRIKGNGRRLLYIGMLPDMGYVRDFTFDNSGQFMFVSDQAANRVRVIKMNWEKGLGTQLPGGIEAELPASFAVIRKKELEIKNKEK